MTPLVERLLGEQLPDGGWNCEVENGATVSSFGTTINVLEGLLEYERAIGGSARVGEARRRGEAYLLERRLFRRKSTGEVIDPDWLRFSFPTWWHYDVLRGLDYLRDAGFEPDERVAEAIGVVEAPAGSRRPLAAPERPRRRGPLPDGGRRGQAEPVEHAPRDARARLVRAGIASGHRRDRRRRSVGEPERASHPAEVLDLLESAPALIAAATAGRFRGRPRRAARTRRLVGARRPRPCASVRPDLGRLHRADPRRGPSVVPRGEPALHHPTLRCPLACRSGCRSRGSPLTALGSMARLRAADAAPWRARRASHCRAAAPRSGPRRTTRTAWPSTNASTSAIFSKRWRPDRAVSEKPRRQQPSSIRVIARTT